MGVLEFPLALSSILLSLHIVYAYVPFRMSRIGSRPAELTPSPVNQAHIMRVCHAGNGRRMLALLRMVTKVNT